jgi:asparagine synthase (glutamine-hydrolysing)
MCGILGFIGASVDKSLFKEQLELLKHRGPDADGYFAINSSEGVSASLGHTRLSIIDLDDRANQPMQDQTGNFTIVYNGEIYNYAELRDDLRANGISFLTNGDTEVLLQGIIFYGPQFLSKVRGMFAFGFWDSRNNSLLIGRDQFGIKPLYFQPGSKSFGFSSQLRTFACYHKNKINPASAFRYLVRNQSFEDGSQIIDGIFELPPAHFMEICLSESGELKSKTTRYWNIDNVRPSKDSFEQATAKVRQLFLQSLELHLKSDVEICATLSGGIDSSSIVCGIRHLQPDREIHTFSYLPEDDKIDESKWINLVNQSVGAIPHAVYASGDLHSLQDMLSAQDEPVGSTSIYAQFLVMQEIKKSGFKVTLDGQGADEYLAGYDRYFAQYLKQCLFDFKIGKFFTVIFGLLSDKRLSPLGLIKLIGAQFAPGWTQSWLRNHLASLPETNYLVGKSFKRPKSEGSLSQTLWKNLSDNNIPTLLRYADRNAMHHSIEGRVPFLYVELVEYIFSLPTHFLFSNKGITKHVFREAMRGIVPDAILNRKDKIGFATPELDWLSTHKEFFLSLVNNSNSEIIDTVKLEETVNALLGGKTNYSQSIWRALNLLLFEASRVRK